MASDKSAEQVREEHVRVLGHALGSVFHALYDEVTWLHVKWKQYKILYDSRESVDLLNQTAGFFFYVIQRTMWEDLVLHVARLSDPPRSMGKDNLTLLRLADAITDPTLAQDVRALVEIAKSQSSFARDWRNRRLAHHDLSLTLGGNVKPLPGISRDKMEHALSAIRAVLNKVELHHWNSEVAFEIFVAHDDAETLSYYLKVAVSTEYQRQERLRQGHPLPDDLGR